MTLTSVFNEAVRYLNDGVSVVPVRTKDESYNGRVYAAKTPTVAWKQFQKGFINEAQLYDLMEKRIDDPAFAVICGQVSGAFEIIDIDEKHDTGISAKYLSQIKAVYPDVYQRLRIHKTPSGGYHLLYRCEELLTDGNQKLAVPEGKKEASIETRGEGGYALAPPSMGYMVIQNNPIPVLSLSERNCLINLAKLYDTRTKEVKGYKPKKRDHDYYDENPWDHFNNSPEAEKLLCDFGWSFYAENNQYIHFTRPGKQHAISASYIREKRIFYIFTTSTELEGGRGYRPGTILGQLQFGGDMKKTYHALVEKGYGKIKPVVEKRLIKSSASRGAPLPANVSKHGQEEYQTEKQRLKATYPYGIFWSGDALEGYKISRESLYRVACGLGFYVQGEDQVVRKDGYVATKVDDRTFFDALKQYINEEDEKTNEAICDAYEAFLQRSGKFTISRLPIFNELLLLKSTKYTSYKFFDNCFISITKKEIKKHAYEELKDHVIWDSEIQHRDFKFVPYKNCLYKQFIDLALENVDHAERAIGYLSHDYKDSSSPYIIVLTESVPDPKEGGGSGKNVFSDLFSLTTTIKDVAGTQVQFNEKFLQLWNHEKIYSLSDVPKRFDFTFLKNVSSNSAVVKKLFKDEKSLNVEDLPKLIISTNYSFDNVDGGLARRIITIEFTDFFTRSGGVDVHFDDKLFPNDWTEEDYQGYDNYIAHCIQRYLQQPKLKAAPLSEGGWLKRFDMAYGKMTRLFIDEYLEKWQNGGFVSNEDFEADYNTFCRENGVRDRYKVSSIKMNDALKEWCENKGVKFEKNVVKKMMGILYRGRKFSEDEQNNEEDDPPF